MARFKMVNGVRIQLTAEEETIRDAEEEKAAIEKTEFDALQYQRDRKKEYPSIADQLDDIYHNGIDAWKATIKVTKDKYPK
jgi:hypothetical protein